MNVWREETFAGALVTQVSELYKISEAALIVVMR